MKLVKTLLISLMIGGLFLAVSGCGTKEIKVRQGYELCERPNDIDGLPLVDGSLPFDHPQNVAAFMERKTIFETYYGQAEAALDCYETQAKGAAK